MNDFLPNFEKHSSHPYEKACGQATAYFSKVLEAFEKAERRIGSIDRTYTVGGHSLRLRFAGSSLVEATVKALEHLPSHKVASDGLTVNLWDSASTHTVFPSIPWRVENIGLNPIVSFKDGRVVGTFELRTRTLNMFDSVSKKAIFYVPDASALPEYQRSAPLRPIFHWWLRTQDLQMIHGAVVGDERSGVMLVGKGGSGKSTTALTCLHDGLKYGGDDYALVALQPSPRAYTLYSSGKLSKQTITKVRHPFSTPSDLAAGDLEKTTLFLNEEYPEKVASNFPLRAILLPRITDGQQTTLRRASSIDCMKALAPSSLMQLRGSQPMDLHRMAEMARRLPSYHLELGVNLSEVSGVIRKLLSEN